jgi:cytochrome c553
MGVVIMARKLLPILVGILALTAQGLVAAPSSNVAWTSETRAKLMAADVEKGRAVYDEENCAKCHGDHGLGEKDYPHLGGLSLAYSYKQLRDYKDKTRHNRRMIRALEELSDEDLVHLAAFTATFPRAPKSEAESDERGEINPAAARPLVKMGDGARLIPSCDVCHGAQARRTPSNLPVGAPKLDGQKHEYFVQTMLAYKERERANDVYGVMRWIARALTDTEIDQLAAYYASRGMLQMQAKAQP